MISSEFLEQAFYGLFRQLDTHNLVPLLNQPPEIDALAAQWHENTATALWQQVTNVAIKNGVDCVDVKLNTIFPPSCKPIVPIFRR